MCQLVIMEDCRGKATSRSVQAARPRGPRHPGLITQLKAGEEAGPEQLGCFLLYVHRKCPVCSCEICM